jgi:Flp pilus assembly protein CpaB
VAAACALGAVFGILSLARAPAGAPLVPVVVAAKPIAVGEVATSTSVRQVFWPAELVPDGAVRSSVAVVGRAVSTPLGRGEPITERRLSTGSLLAGRPPQEVAVHLSLPDIRAVSMLHAGDRVDLLGPRGTVAERVTVLAVDTSLSTDFGAVIQGQGSSSGYAPDGAGLVIAAGPGDAQAIAAVPPDALGRPDLTVVLRSPGAG